MHDMYVVVCILCTHVRYIDLACSRTVKIDPRVIQIRMRTVKDESARDTSSRVRGIAFRSGGNSLLAIAVRHRNSRQARKISVFQLSKSGSTPSGNPS